MDLSFIIGDDVNACAGYVVCEINGYTGGCRVIYEDMEMIELMAPYVPGYLAFREAGPLFRVIERQRRERPEVTPQVRKEKKKGKGGQRSEIRIKSKGARWTN